MRIVLLLSVISTVQAQDKPAERFQYFYEQRRFPGARIPEGARLRALQTLDRIRAGTFTPRAAGTDGKWKLIGPQPIAYSSNGFITSGRITALAVDPRGNDTVYAGAADGGVWKTTDGGTTWVPLTDDQPSLSIGSVAIDPANPDTIYAGTGEENFNFDAYSGVGILKSIDGGESWTNIVGPFLRQRVGALAVHPADGKTVLAASTDGLYRSSDGGASWTRVLTGIATSVFFDPIAQNVAWAAVGSVAGAASNGVYRSTDFGATWTLRNGTGPGALPSGAQMGRIEIVNMPASPDSVLAAVANRVTANGFSSGSTLNGIYRTLDGGQTWRKLNAPDFCQPQCWYDMVIRSHPMDPSIIFAGGVGLIRSLDGGASWQSPPAAAPGAPHVDNHALQFTSDGSRLYNGNDGGAWSTDAFRQNTIAWNDLNATLALTQYYPGQAIDPANPHIGLAGAQDNGSHLYTGHLAWTRVSGGDGGWAAIDPSSPNIAYVSTQNISVFRTAALLDTNSVAIPVVHGIDQNDRRRFIGAYVLDPSNPQRMYYGTYRLYQSLDGGGLWQAISPDLTHAPPGTLANNSLYTISTIAVSPVDPKTIYTGSVSGAIFQTTDGGRTWNDRTAGLPLRAATHMAADPVDPSTVYVTYSGYFSANDPQPGHVFKSLDGGQSWMDISGDLPNVPVDDLVIDPDLPGTLYIGTDLGAMISTDGGNSWTVLGSNLPRVAVTSLVLHRPSRILRAGTHGRSMWDYALPPVSTAQPAIASLSPSSVDAGGGAFTLTVAGSNLGAGMHALWNGQDRQVTSATPTSMTVRIPASDIQTVGRASVVVFNPSQGGGASVPASFLIGPAPSIKAGGLVSATNGGTTSGSPGALMTLLGANLTGSTEQSSGFPLPFTLGGVTVNFGNVPVPLLYVSPTQINFQVPFTASTTIRQSVTVSQGNQVSSAVQLTMAPVTPSLFSTNSQGTGQGSIRIANSAAIAAPAGMFPGSRPAQRGEYIEIYCTGLGRVTPTGVTGAAAGSLPLSTTVLPSTVTIGGLPASVIFSGLAPGVAGLYQVDAQIPADVVPGDRVPVVLSIGGVTSNMVTVAVQ
jgi:uncharacterized protein (TIGR03437 family)